MADASSWLRGLLAASVLAGGCGTIADLRSPDPPCSRGTQVYGGVLLDVAFMGAGGLVTFVFILDLPLSFVADTLLLPVTIPRQRAMGRVTSPAGARRATGEVSRPPR